MAPDDDLARKKDAGVDVLEEKAFESQRATVNGISVSLDEFIDHEGAGEKGYTVSFFDGNGGESVKLFLPLKYAKDLFDLACKSVPAEHPQRLYIAYGIVKRAVEAKRNEADEAAKQQEATRRATLRTRLDTAYTESVETKAGPVEIRWMEEAGKDGCFVIIFPEDARDRRRENVFPVTMRPDLAEKFFNRAVSALNGGMSSREVMRHLWEAQQQISRVRYENRDEPRVLWSQDEGVEFPDIFYRENAEVNGVKILVFWDDMSHEFRIMFGGLDVSSEEARERGIYDSVILIDEKTDHAKEVLAYAKEQAQKYGKDKLLDLYEDVERKTREITKMD
jgi:hypothetical protein